MYDDLIFKNYSDHHVTWYNNNQSIPNIQNTFFEINFIEKKNSYNTIEIYWIITLVSFITNYLINVHIFLWIDSKNHFEIYSRFKLWIK